MITKIIIILVLVGSAFGAFHYVNKSVGLEDDNWIEENAEEIFEEIVSIEVDFTPNSQEPL